MRCPSLTLIDRVSDVRAQLPVHPTAALLDRHAQAGEPGPDAIEAVGFPEMPLGEGRRQTASGKIEKRPVWEAAGLDKLCR